jgi:hypothetical protein
MCGNEKEKNQIVLASHSQFQMLRSEMLDHDNQRCSRIHTTVLGSMLAEKIMGRQCHSQQTLRPTTRTNNTSTTTATTTTVYGTEILDADDYDYCLDANANAGTNTVDPSDDDSYAYQVESSQLTPIRSNRNRNRLPRSSSSS